MKLGFQRIALVLTIGLCQLGYGALSISLDDLVMVPPAQPVNEMDLTLSTDVVGSDTESVTFSGQMMADMDFQFSSGNATLTGLSFTGGRVAVSDTTFSLALGLLQIQATGLSGTPQTPLPPGSVTGATFPGAEHVITIDQGMVTAAGQTIDFAVAPLTTIGSGTGTLSAAVAAGTLPDTYEFDVSVSLPVVLNESFLITGIPIFGDVNATLSGNAIAMARQQVTVTLIPGDYNQDLQLDCADADRLSLAIAAQSTDLTFDSNEDGTVNLADYKSWIVDLKGTLEGDANLDFIVNGEDFLVWNTNKFNSNTTLCTADFNGDRITDGADFLLWNAHKFLTADRGDHVPEPTGWWFLGIFTVAAFRGKVGLKSDVDMRTLSKLD